MVGAARSGAGKTAVTLGLVAALRARGLRVGVAKAGPDYLDTRLLGRAARRPAFNLDAFLTGRDGPARSLALAARGADVVIAEGAMGLLDGAPTASTPPVASSAHLARTLGLGLVLVLDATSTAQTVGAVALGLATASGVAPLGVIANRVRSAHHGDLVAEGLARVGIALLGHIAEGALDGLAQRHLGLVDPSELDGFDAWLERARYVVEESVDLEALVRRAPELRLVDPELGEARSRVPVALSVGPSARFRYEENLLRLEAAGAELLPFDPLEEVPDPHARLLWLHGGYPEHYQAALADNGPLWPALRRAANEITVIAECGGYALLARSLEGSQMAGVVPVAMRLGSRPVLGYRSARLVDGPFGARSLPAHEFHYLVPEDDPGEIDVVDARGEPRPGGVVSPRLLASFLHFHLGVDPGLAGDLLRRAGGGGSSETA
ncbi:cobyrinate a,c-diamide synthase [Acidimicrobium ferrooxidans]|uniref:cobyrinate a,c-diamide synthase n=1 Tax=Acidimicrobium ferrooxidans TaxID=53635 RepID=UPI001FE06171|nr:cobyrinate a,c-diamide synthase [Acidimicrobium ferrooxidans]